MESLKGGVSFKVNFINSGDNPGNSSVESQRLIGIYDSNWSLGEDGVVTASMAFARRVGGVRCHGNLIERLYGMGERSARVSLPKCLDTVDPAEADGRLIADLVSCFHGNVDFGSKWREYKKMAIEQGFYV